MRNAFMDELLLLARGNPRIFLVVGDLGYSVVEPFAAEFPDRFLNAGVAEQNMAGVASGLAAEGFHVFTYSIANFPVFRCLEQIRNDICYHNRSVTTVAVGGGLSYGNLGYSHHGVEDLAVTRVLPNMAVAAPGDPIETRGVLRELVAKPGPSYLRLGKAGEPTVHPSAVACPMGAPVHVRAGRHVTLCSTGGILAEMMKAADMLKADGIEADCWSLPWLTTADLRQVLDSASRTGHLFSVEEHGQGGLFPVLAEAVAESQTVCRLHALRAPREPNPVAGDQAFLRSVYGLSAEKIVKKVRDMVRMTASHP